MKALVTGCAGFVGSAISRRLLNDGCDVKGVDCVSDYYDVRQKHENLNTLISGNFELCQEDLMTTDLDACLDGVDVIFHQAGQPGVRKSWGTDFATYTRNNVNVTQRLLEAILVHRPQAKIIYASSSSVYGDAEVYPTSELDRPSPNSPYGVTKLAAEHLCSLYARNFGLDTVSLRYFTVYGPGQRPDMAFHKFLKAAHLDQPIEVFGSGRQIRDFTFIDDVVEANLLAANTATPSGAVLNVSGGSSVTLEECINHIRDITGRTLEINYARVVKGDVDRTGGSVESISRILKWKPTVQVRDGLSMENDWIEKLIERA